MRELCPIRLNKGQNTMTRSQQRRQRQNRIEIALIILAPPLAILTLALGGALGFILSNGGTF